MRFAPSASLLSLFLALQLLPGCASPADNRAAANSGAANSANASNPTAKDNVEEFADLVRLPFTPDEVAWKDVAGKGTVAVVRLSSEDAEKMSAELGKGGQPTVETLTVESWYPAELLAQSELTGESIIKGQTYPATQFLNPPYTQGKITRIEGTDYFILQISS